jgi:tight adherence protein B
MSGTITAQLIPALAFGSVFLLVFGLQRSLNTRSEKLERQLGRFTSARAAAPVASSGVGLTRQRRRLSSFQQLDRVLEQRSFTAAIDRQLASAALPLRVGEYLLIRWAAALGLGLAAAVLSHLPVAAVPAAAVGYMLPAFFVTFRRKQRASAFEQQLVEALALISGGLRAGYSFLQGAEAVVRELPAPIQEEFGMVLEDLRVGVSIEEAMTALGQRVPSEELDMLVTSILVQRQSGGNLAEILDTIAYTIRERLRIRREVSTLTAQERMSSYVVGALPIVAFVFLTFTNPDYLDTLFGTPLGQMLAAGAVVLEVIGFYIIRRIIDIKV